MGKRDYVKKIISSTLVSILFCLSIITSQLFFLEKACASENLDKLAGKRAGVLTGTPQEKFILAKMKEPKLLYFNSFLDMAMALKQNRIDYCIAPDTTFKMIQKKYPELMQLDDVVKEVNISMIIPKSEEGKALQKEINQYISRIKSEGRLEAEVKYWFYTKRENPQVDIPETGEKGVLHMATSSTLVPYSYIQDGKLVGFDISLMADFCHRNGYGLEIEQLDLPGVISGIATKKYDVAASCIAYTKERAKSVLFCDTTYTQVIRPVVRKADFQVAEKVEKKETLGEKLHKNFIEEKRYLLFLNGILTTLGLTLFSVLGGSILGFFICLLRLSEKKMLSTLAKSYIWFFQGMPIVILLLIMYYVVFSDESLPAFWVAVVAFSLNFAAYASEILRTGIEAVDKGQLEAALVLGYNRGEAFLKFVFRQALKKCLPVYRGQIIALLKGTSVVGFIAVSDLTKAGNIIMSRTFEPFFPLMAAAIVYFALSYILGTLLEWGENKLFNSVRDPLSSRMLKGVDLHGK